MKFWQFILGLTTLPGLGGVLSWLHDRAEDRMARNVFASESRRVTVSDGRLTLDQGSAPHTTTRINYVEIRPAP